MASSFHGLRGEIASTLRLAGPVVAAELGWMAMATVDTIMLGRVGREALGGASTGEALFHWVALFGIGLLLGLDTLIAQAYGARKIRDCRHSLRQGVLLSVALTPVLMGVVALSPPLMRWWGVTEAVYANAVDYMYAVNWSILPLLVYAAFRRYLQAIGQVHAVMFALVSANIVNAFFNWIFIFGNLGAPALGAAGSGYSTTLARVYMAGALIVYTAWLERRANDGPLQERWSPDWKRLGHILRLGFPAAVQIALEVGVFGAATVLAATLSTVAVAAHQIALNTAALTFMVPLGVSSAAAVRVGHAVGARNPHGVRMAGWSSIAVGCAFMAVAGAAFVLAPRAILRIYTDDATVIALGTILLYVAAVFQLFDGLQVVTIGALRGLGDTRTPVIANIAGFWLLGLPVGWLLCFRGRLGVIGVWVGLSVGLIVVAILLLAIWFGHSRRLAASIATATSTRGKARPAQP